MLQKYKKTPLFPSNFAFVSWISLSNISYFFLFSIYYFLIANVVKIEEITLCFFT